MMKHANPVAKPRPSRSVHRAVFVLAFAAAYAGDPSLAQATQVGASRNLGLGVAAGSPTSLVGKYFVGGGNAWDFGLGFWSLGGRCGNVDSRFCNDGFDLITVNVDYLWQEKLVSGRVARLDWHIGAGGRVWVGDGDRDRDGEFAAAARMPVGVDLTFRKPDFLELFLEIAPALYLVRSIDLDIEAFLGVRFYF